MQTRKGRQKAKEHIYKNCMGVVKGAKMNYKCSECHNENLFISFSADYLGTVKIGGIDEARKQAKASGINNIMCANCGASIKLHEQAENKQVEDNE